MLEIIATSLADCLDISKSGADRIELCTDLEDGGYTPDHDLIKLCTSAVSVPIRVMIRRQNKDFFYHFYEFQKFKKDIKFVKTTSAEGIVVGLLTRDYQIDVPHMSELINLAYPLKVTFHRAFDVVADPLNSLKILKDLGVTTVLTRGGILPINENLNVLKTLRDQHLVQVQAGGGVDLINFKSVANAADSVHLGRLARLNNDFNNPINVPMIKTLKSQMVK